NDFHQRLKGNQIFNAAALIVDVQTGEVLAYIGNTRSGAEHQEMVDIIRSPRSTGSILKPFLFAALLEEGKLLPTTLVPDVPTLISGFAPKNFSKQYDGAVSASQALVRSLNVPAVLELRDYRYEKFYNLLQSIGMTTLSKPADHYGLSLVLGGAEGTLWDITGMYASCARILTNYFQRPGQNRYGKSDFHSLQYVFSDDKSPSTLEPTSQLGASSLWSTFETLRELYRPGEETGWQHFSSSKPIAWKTGTSFGSRDGWAVGVTPDYAVGVWVGNADGEGRPGLTGTETAAPLMFEIFSSLPGQTWFQKPLSELVNIPVCALSGKRATSLCQRVDTVSAPNAGLTSGPCTEHALVHLSSDGKYRVHGDCESMDRVKSVSWFVLPPVQEYYFKSRNLSYKPLPPYRKDCLDPSAVAMMDIVYPKANARIYLPVQLTGEQNSAVFEVTHRRPGAIVYWHLDGNFIGTSKNTHRLGLAPSPGKHTLTLVDDSGNSLERYFTILFRQ
ncbi:MAG: penicillin-binding protein 1C, partial [Cyclobacteriaceae bacterium]|nr:penicillin-binding protein 1C [Cyclobacteriaceae bacterium]